MIKTIEQADLALADAVWWLKGFAAARPASIDEGGGEHRALESRLAELRIFLDRVANADVRRIGDEQAVVLTYAEFEKVFDAFRANSDGADRALGRETMRRVMAAYRDDERSQRTRMISDDDIPF